MIFGPDGELDLDAIADGVGDVPRLKAEVRRLRAELAEAKALAAQWANEHVDGTA